ncbi:MAG: hypothetical protein R3F14_28445 [Polyangiaceae bacterium]
MNPDGWTDDLSITVDPETTLDELVDFILEHQSRRGAASELFEVLTTRFGLCAEDVELALDRVGGGRTRAGTKQPENAPDPVKDPVAHVAYRRARGAPAPARRDRRSAAWGELVRRAKGGDVEGATAFARSEEMASRATPEEQEAARLWCHAVGAAREGALAATSSGAAVRLVELATALASGPRQERALGNLLLQAGVAISSVGEERIRTRGPERCAPAGTPAWFDAIRLSEAARELGRLFAGSGDFEGEGRAVQLRGRIGLRCSDSATIAWEA